MLSGSMYFMVVYVSRALGVSNVVSVCPLHGVRIS